MFSERQVLALALAALGYADDRVLSTFIALPDSELTRLARVSAEVSHGQARPTGYQLLAEPGTAARTLASIHTDPLGVLDALQDHGDALPLTLEAAAMALTHALLRFDDSAAVHLRRALDARRLVTRPRLADAAADELVIDTAVMMADADGGRALQAVGESIVGDVDDMPVLAVRLLGSRLVIAGAQPGGDVEVSLVDRPSLPQLVTDYLRTTALDEVRPWAANVTRNRGQPALLDNLMDQVFHGHDELVASVAEDGRLAIDAFGSLDRLPWSTAVVHGVNWFDDLVIEHRARRRPGTSAATPKRVAVVRAPDVAAGVLPESARLIGWGSLAEELHVNGPAVIFIHCHATDGSGVVAMDASIADLNSGALWCGEGDPPAPVTAAEIAELDLRESPVVVAACGSGAIVSEQGAQLGPVAALLAAGAPWVLASPWKALNHRHTVEFINEFIATVQEGIDPAHALKTLQRSWSTRTLPWGWQPWRIIR